MDWMDPGKLFSVRAVTHGFQMNEEAKWADHPSDEAVAGWPGRHCGGGDVAERATEQLRLALAMKTGDSSIKAVGGQFVFQRWVEIEEIERGCSNPLKGLARGRFNRSDWKTSCKMVDK